MTVTTTTVLDLIARARRGEELERAGQVLYEYVGSAHPKRPTPAHGPRPSAPCRYCAALSNWEAAVKGDGIGQPAHDAADVINETGA